MVGTSGRQRVLCLDYTMDAPKFPYFLSNTGHILVCNRVVIQYSDQLKVAYSGRLPFNPITLAASLFMTPVAFHGSPFLVYYLSCFLWSIFNCHLCYGTL